MPEPRFVDPSPPSKRRSAVGPVPEAVVPSPDNQGDVVSSVVPDDDLSDLFPADPPIGDMPVGRISADRLQTSATLLVHVLEDGFTASGQVWYRGQEIEYTVGDQAYEDTKDRNGVSWLTFDDAAQMRAWGQVLFRFGPWPGSDYEDPRAAEAERSRSRRPRALAGIAPPSPGSR